MNALTWAERADMTAFRYLIASAGVVALSATAGMERTVQATSAGRTRRRMGNLRLVLVFSIGSLRRRA
jgi:hypothetical protein